VHKEPHILIIVQNLPVPFDRRVWQEAVSLRRAGFAVSVICPKKQIYTAGYERMDGVDIYRYSMLWDADRATLGFCVEFVCCWLAALLLAIRVYLRHPFQAIHACNPPDTYFALALLFRPFGVKFVFDHHDLCPEMYVAKGRSRRRALYRGLLLLERLTLRTADAVIAVNQSHRDLAVRRGRIDNSKITIVRSGPRYIWSEVQTYNQELKRGRRFSVVFLGEMGNQDGVDLLLRVIEQYARSYPKDVLFTLIGGGPEQPRMKEMAHQLGLDEWVCFTGRVSKDEILWQHLATADVCIAPDPFSDYGDMSTTNKIIEYLAFGKPVVAFDLTEHRRTAESAAIYVSPNDEVALCDATRDLLVDEEKRRTMGREGQQRFRTQLAWENSEKALVALYSTLLNADTYVKPVEMNAPVISSMRRDS
jgi:glycosyltransferase involved in cell wall biosynthesis